MRRRRPEIGRDGYPSPLAVFDVADWWVTDPEDAAQVGYARIGWGVARRAYRDGEDWEHHLKPPVWWAGDGPAPQPERP